MHDPFFLLISVIVLATVFDFINGFRDTANAIATSVSTRGPVSEGGSSHGRISEYRGRPSGTAVVRTVGSGLVEAYSVTRVTVIPALLSAIIWDIITWYFSLPTCSSHASLSSLAGAAVATSGAEAIIEKEVIDILTGLIASPIVGLVLGYFLMMLLIRMLKNVSPALVNKIFNRSQLVSAAYMAFSHGSNDAQKTVGIITMALVSYFRMPAFHVPFWVIVLSATAMGLGTAFGGWRVLNETDARKTEIWYSVT
jgi:PiT family inorganic phosphate transporter